MNFLIRIEQPRNIGSYIGTTAGERLVDTVLRKIPTNMLADPETCELVTPRGCEQGSMGGVGASLFGGYRHEATSCAINASLVYCHGWDVAKCFTLMTALYEGIERGFTARKHTLGYETALARMADISAKIPEALTRSGLVNTRGFDSSAGYLTLVYGDLAEGTQEINDYLMSMVMACTVAISRAGVTSVAAWWSAMQCCLGQGVLDDVMGVGVGGVGNRIAVVRALEDRVTELRAPCTVALYAGGVL